MLPTYATRVSLALMAFIIVASAAYLIVQYPSLPVAAAGAFQDRTDRRTAGSTKTPARVLMPVLVQVALASTLRRHRASCCCRARMATTTRTAPDVQAAAVAAEAVTLIALIWVTFQGYAAWALGPHVDRRAGRARAWYTHLRACSGFVATGVVAVRAHGHLGRPAPRPYVAAHWRFGQLYKNPQDPALFVPTRDGSRWTLNFGRPSAAALLGLILLIGIVGPTVILVLALRS